MQSPFAFPSDYVSILSGPPLVDKLDVVLRYAPTERQFLLISTDDDMEHLQAKHTKRNPAFQRLLQQQALRTIDCYSMQADGSKGTATTSYVSSPVAFTDICVLIDENLTTMKAPIVVVSSLSTILLYAKLENVVQFLQTIIQKVRKGNGTLLLLLEDGMHEKQTLATIQHLADQHVMVVHDGQQIRYRSVSTADLMRGVA